MKNNKVCNNTCIKFASIVNKSEFKSYFNIDKAFNEEEREEEPTAKKTSKSPTKKGM